MAISDTFAVLFSPRLLLALLLFAAASALLEMAARWVHAQVEDVPLSNWLVEHLGLPWSRALAIVGFILLARPALFPGHAPPSTVEADLTGLINLAVLVSLLLPLIPLVGRPALVLPVQGVALSALLFHWSFPQAEVSYWPGMSGALTLAAIALGGGVLAGRLAENIGERLDSLANRSGFELLIRDGMLLLFQAPALILYGVTLAGQL